MDLCRRLDGVPLAIELAAVRTRVLTAEQILDRLTDRFSLLTGEAALLYLVIKHSEPRSTGATICWREPSGRSSGGWACSRAGSPWRTSSRSWFRRRARGRALDLLSSLVDKSLVMREDAKGRACYRLHETMGEYTRLKLREAGEEDVVELRCADFYVSRCQRAAEQPVRYELPGWLEWMELEIDNIRSVLRRCLIHADFPRGIELACSIGWY